MAADGTEIAGLVKRRLGRARAANIDADILAEINQMARRYDKKPTKFWFQVERSATVPLAIGQIVLPTGLPPADFLREYEEYSLYMEVDGVMQPCIKEDLDMVVQIGNAGELTAWDTPHYSLDGNFIRIGIAFTEIKNFEMFYYKSSPDLATLGDTNLWITNAEDLVIGTVGESIGIGINSPRVPYFTSLRQEAYQDLVRFNTGRVEAAISRVMGQ